MRRMTAAQWSQVLERVEVEARDLDPRKVALTLLAAPLFAVGFVLACAARVVWTVLTWMWVALLVGWDTAGGHDGRHRSDGPV